MTDERAALVARHRQAIVEAMPWYDEYPADYRELDAALLALVDDALALPPDQLLLPFRIIGYTAEECEREMRRMTNGERGCSNPDEHLDSLRLHMEEAPPT